jgi:cytoskeletal protein CcmA (bactofilin family)
MLDLKDPDRPVALSAHAGRPADLLAIVGDRARLEGTFEIADSIEIACAVDGTLRVGGTLVIGEDGVVHADVHTVDAVVRGHYEGNMTATGTVEIAATGHVSGNLRTDSLVIARGGFFNGNVTKVDEQAEPAAAGAAVLVGDGRAGHQAGSR